MAEDWESDKTPWTAEFLERLKADRQHDAERMAPKPYPKGLPDPREADLRMMRARERLIQNIERRKLGQSQKIRRSFDRSR